MTFIIFALAPFLLSQTVVGNFSYDGNNGPSHWGDEYKSCLGKYQSPIDIEEKDVTVTTFPPLQFSNVQSPHAVYMINNGHTVMIQSTDSDVPTISGGPINDTYVFQQLHFHWGQSDDVGSEDLINNRSFSMELHAVFYKKSYESSEEAMKHPDGLTVIGYLYQATDEANPIFDSITPLISEITEVGFHMTINDDTVLNKLIAPDIVQTQEYYTYKGSLTTPPCSEIVQWIDFKQPLTISHDQLAAFRNIHSVDGKNVTQNFRPVQPLDGRIIYRNSAAGTTEAPSETTPKATDASTMAPAPPASTTSTAPPAPPATRAPPAPPAPPVPPVTSTARPEHKNETQHSGQMGMCSTSPLALIFGTVFFLLFQ